MEDGGRSEVRDESDGRAGMEVSKQHIIRFCTKAEMALAQWVTRPLLSQRQNHVEG